MFNRHIHYAGHLHIASGGCGHGGYTWHSGEDTFAARLLHTNARSVCVLPSGADRVRVFAGYVADGRSGGFRWAGTGLRVGWECRHEGKRSGEEARAQRETGSQNGAKRMKYGHTSQPQKKYKLYTDYLIWSFVYYLQYVFFFTYHYNYNYDYDFNFA